MKYIETERILISRVNHVLRMLVNLLLAHSIWSLTSLGTISHGARKVYQPILGREHIGHLLLCHYRILVQSEYCYLPLPLPGI